MSKRSQKIKEKILEALEDETPFQETIKGLTPLFFNLAIMSMGINIAIKNLK